MSHIKPFRNPQLLQLAARMAPDQKYGQKDGSKIMRGCRVTQNGNPQSRKQLVPRRFDNHHDLPQHTIYPLYSAENMYSHSSLYRRHYTASSNGVGAFQVVEEKNPPSGLETFCGAALDTATCAQSSSIAALETQVMKTRTRSCQNLLCLQISVRQ